MACPPFEPGSGFVSGILRFVDCEVQMIGTNGYQAFAGTESPFSIVLTGLLTLFVAVFAYRMLLGYTPGVRDGVLAVTKIGIVLVLATNWGAYKILIYDVVLHGPAELAAQIGEAANIPGTGGGLVGRLEAADKAFVALSMAGAGQGALDQRMPPLFGGFDAFALGLSRVLFLLGIIGSFATVRLIAGLLLAVAPLFIALLLFDSTRGLFEGWFRVLFSTLLGAFGTAVILGVELALLEPWLTNLLLTRAAGQPIPNAPVELLVVSLAFCLVLAAMLSAMVRLAMGFRLSTLWPDHVRLPGFQRPEVSPISGVSHSRSGPASPERTRALVIAQAVTAGQRRETVPPSTALDFSRSGSASVTSGSVVAATPQTARQSAKRRTTGRVSASAAKRDRS